MADFFRQDGSLKMTLLGLSFSLLSTGMLLAEGRWRRASEQPLSQGETTDRPVRVVGVAVAGPETIEGVGGRACLARWRAVEDTTLRSFFTGENEDRCAERKAAPFSVVPQGGGPPVKIDSATGFRLISEGREQQLHPASLTPAIPCVFTSGPSIERCLLAGDVVEIHGQLDPTTGQVTPAHAWGGLLASRLSSPPAPQPFGASTRMEFLLGMLAELFLCALLTFFAVGLDPPWLVELRRRKK